MRDTPFRRHQRERMRQKLSKRLQWVYGDPQSMLNLELGRQVSRELNHGKRCSCPMCGNPRKWYKEKTIQEKKADESLKDGE